MAAAAVVAVLLAAATSAGALTLYRGIRTPLYDGQSMLDVRSVYDELWITDAYVAPGLLDSRIRTYVARIQYDIRNTIALDIPVWTVHYDPLAAPHILAASTPNAYIDRWGNQVKLGGTGYVTMLNNGFGLYDYNTGAPWTIDLQPDHITFTGPGFPSALPGNAAVGATLEAGTVPTFSILFTGCLELSLEYRASATGFPGGQSVGGYVLAPKVPAPIAEPGGLIALALPTLGLWLTRRRGG